MKIALLSDTSTPTAGPQPAYARAHGARQIRPAGDLVGYGADPGPVLDRVMQLVAEGTPCARQP